MLASFFKQTFATVLLYSSIAAIASAEDHNIVHDNSWISWLPMTEVVPQGAVGIFKRGAFLNGTYDPGVYHHAPIVTTLLSVNTRPQVDYLTNIECGTRDGLKIEFPKISIYNMLGKANAWDIISRFGEAYDSYLVVQPAIQAINELCSKMTAQQLYIDNYDTLNEELTTQLRYFQEGQGSSLQITQVTVSKPNLPRDIHDNYQKIVSEQTKTIAVMEEHKRRKKEEETTQERKRLEEENKKILSLMEYDKKTAEAIKQAELSKIEVDKERYKKQTLADAEAYARNMTSWAEAEAKRRKGQAESEVVLALGKADAIVKAELAKANEPLLTDNFVRIKYAEAFRDSQHLKIIIGDSIPKAIMPLIDFKTVQSMIMQADGDTSDLDDGA